MINTYMKSEMANARVKVHEAVRTGKLKKGKKCFVCGAGYRIVAHHSDYGKPLAVIWFCNACHMRWHTIMSGNKLLVLKEKIKWITDTITSDHKFMHKVATATFKSLTK